MKTWIVTFTLLFFFFALSVHAESDKDVENIEVRGQKLDSLSKDVTSYNLNLDIGLNALHSKNYEKAFRRLNESAKQGNKISQFYLASMYFNGQGTKIDNRLGWIWLNLAMEQKIPQWRFAFAQISRSIPEDFQKAWEPDIDEFLSKYGAEATNHACRQRRNIGSNLKLIICERFTDGTYEHAQWRTIQKLFFQP